MLNNASFPSFAENGSNLAENGSNLKPIPLLSDALDSSSLCLLLHSKEGGSERASLPSTLEKEQKHILSKSSTFFF